MTPLYPGIPRRKPRAERSLLLLPKMTDFVQAKGLTTVSDFTINAAASCSATATSLAPYEVDGVIVDNLLSEDEAAQLVAAAECSKGFAFWDPEGGEVRRAVRNADTLEFEDEEFCAALWSRLAPFVPASVPFSEDDEERFEPDLEGEWVATGLNPHLLLNRYAGGGHFAPHADGSTLVDFNHRSLYTVLIYLNHCADGGGTQLLSSEVGETSELSASGARVARPESVLYRVGPVCGRAVTYYHQTLHAGETVGDGCCKYCLRTDVMYRRKEPLCTAPDDIKAFELVLAARAREAAGEPMEAVPLYRRARRLSEGIARACRLR